VCYKYVHVKCLTLFTLTTTLGNIDNPNPADLTFINRSSDRHLPGNKGST